MNWGFSQDVWLHARWNVRQPVTFNVRADVVRRSLPQLKWLLEMTSASTITVISPTHTDVSQPLPLLDLTCVSFFFTNISKLVAPAIYQPASLKATARMARYCRISYITWMCNMCISRSVYNCIHLMVIVYVLEISFVIHCVAVWVILHRVKHAV